MELALARDDRRTIEFLVTKYGRELALDVAKSIGDEMLLRWIQGAPKNTESSS